MFEWILIIGDWSRETVAALGGVLMMGGLALMLVLSWRNDFRPWQGRFGTISTALWITSGLGWTLLMGAVLTNILERYSVDPVGFVVAIPLPLQVSVLSMLLLLGATIAALRVGRRRDSYDTASVFFLLFLASIFIGFPVASVIAGLTLALFWSIVWTSVIVLLALGICLFILYVVITALVPIR